MRARVVSPANIALVKHWGTEWSDDLQIRVPVSHSLSFNLDACTTTTNVVWKPTSNDIKLQVNKLDSPQAVELKRQDEALQMIEYIKSVAGINWGVEIESVNNFPSNAGIASSASGFSALAGGLFAALPSDLKTKLPSLAHICARGGSFSALRSLADGVTQLRYEQQQFKVESISVHPDLALVDIVVMVDQRTKAHTSGSGQSQAHTSPLQAARLALTKAHFKSLNQALKDNDVLTIMDVTRENSSVMHAVMQTQSTPLRYFNAHTLMVIEALEHSDLKDWSWTLDAGANPHIITTESNLQKTLKLLASTSFEVRVNRPGPGLTVIESDT